MSSPVIESQRAAGTPEANGRKVVLKVRNLKKYFPINAGIILQRQVGAVKAVDDISFDVYEGETLGLVGESGCGKSTTGRTVLQLYRPTSGSVEFEGRELTTMPAAELRRMRRRMQMIFQDPYASLNPRWRVREVIAEPLRVLGLASSKAEIEGRVAELLAQVGLAPEDADKYPHEFSGGQRQRIGLARALAMRPTVLVADEPVSALDVSVQAQVLRLLRDLRDRLSLSIVFITHDLRVAAELCDRIAVMHEGEIVEHGPTAEVFAAPRHDYTRTLMDSIPGRTWTPPALEPA